MKRVHLFGFFGLAATGAGTLTGSALLLQKGIGRAVFASNLTLTILTITLLLAGAQILRAGFASEIVSRHQNEPGRKANCVARATMAPAKDLEFREEDAVVAHGGGGNRLENHANPSPTLRQPLEQRPVLTVSAHEPRLVRKISRNGPV